MKVCFGKAQGLDEGERVKDFVRLELFSRVWAGRDYRLEKDMKGKLYGWVIDWI